MTAPSQDPKKPKEPDGLPNLTETFLPSQDISASNDPFAATNALSLPRELLTLTQYEVLKSLGAGGMGQVYLAKDIPLNRNVVLKVIKTERLHRSSAIERFTREMQAAARLNHPNVVTAYTSHQIGEFLVFVMEYVPGDDLSKLVKSSGRLAVTNAVYYIHQVARGLQHAHENGLVHRDIKPSNLILNKNGKKHTVKILDFGLAKARSEDEEPNTGLTGMGKMLGTPDYVAPEQIRDASSADIRADLYSLGCTMYYILAGEPPFRGRNEFELQEAHVFKSAKPLNFVRPEVPIELANIVAKMMAKEPAKRYQTPQEIVTVLTPFLKGGLSPAGSAQPPIVLLEEDNERSTEIKPGTGTARPLTMPVAKPLPTPSKAEVPFVSPIQPMVSSQFVNPLAPTIGTPMAAPMGSPMAAPMGSPMAAPMGSPMAAPAQSRPSTPGESLPATPTAETKGSDDRHARSTQVDEENGPVRRRRRDDGSHSPVNLSKLVWWLIWGYSQLIFMLLVAGVAAEFHGSHRKSDASSTVNEKSSTSKSSERIESTPIDRSSIFLLELPAILALMAILILLTRQEPLAADSAPRASSARWYQSKWWAGSFLLSWLFGLSTSTLFAGSNVLMVVAFLAVLGLGSGISYFLSRSTGAAVPNSNDNALQA